MTIKLLGQYGAYPANSIISLDTITEAALIAANQATATLTGGQVWVTPGNSPPAWPGPLTVAQAAATKNLVEGNANTYLRWCIPGRDTSGTLFKDVSGHGNDATIEASNTGAFSVDSRMGTIAHATAGGAIQTLAASLLDLATDSIITAVSMTRADPAANANVFSWGANPSTAPGFYLSHRLSAAGVCRIITQRGDTTSVSGSDSTVKFSNVGGTEERHALMAYDAPSRSFYLYRDGVLVASNVALMTGSNAWASTAITQPARLGGQAGGSTFVGTYRGWQGYVFGARGLPLNIGRIAAMMAEAPSVPLGDNEFAF